MTGEESRRLDRQKLFEAAQRPSSWLSSAERLREAAEVIFAAEQHREKPYFEAYQEACETARGQTDHSAEIRADPPNYVPAQMLYAFAIENILKGIIVAKDPTKIRSEKIAFDNHTLAGLAAEAGVDLAIQDPTILEALTELAVWAGRYPSAKKANDYTVRMPLAVC